MHCLSVSVSVRTVDCPRPVREIVPSTEFRILFYRLNLFYCFYYHHYFFILWLRHIPPPCPFLHVLVSSFLFPDHKPLVSSPGRFTDRFLTFFFDPRYLPRRVGSASQPVRSIPLSPTVQYCTPLDRRARGMSPNSSPLPILAPHEMVSQTF